MSDITITVQETAVPITLTESAVVVTAATSEAITIVTELEQGPAGEVTEANLRAVGDAIYQPIDNDLTAIAALTPSNDDFLQRKAGAWARRTIAQVKSDLSLSGSNTGDQDLSGLMVKTANLSDVANAATARSNLGVAIGSDIQAWSAVLDATTASFTTADKSKLDGIASGATANDTDANLKNRSNHSGTQPATTISDFNSAALSAAPAETVTTIGALTNGATAKTTPIDADQIGLVDSAESNVLKKLSWANLKATLKTYFDTLYQAVLVSGTNIKTINGSSLLGSGDLTVSGGGGISDGDKGDITVSGTGATWTIDNGAVSYAKIQNVSATDRLLGRSTTGAGTIEEITCTAAGRALLDDADAAAQKTTLGLGNVNNTADADKPLSTAAVTALSGKASNADNLSNLTDFAVARANLGLEIGVDVQAFLPSITDNGTLAQIGANDVALTNLPTTTRGAASYLWNDNGTLRMGTAAAGEITVASDPYAAGWSSKLTAPSKQDVYNEVQIIETAAYANMAAYGGMV